MVFYEVSKILFEKSMEILIFDSFNQNFAVFQIFSNVL